MANIDLRAFTDQKKREFSVAGQGSTRWEQDVVDAINAATRLINQRCDLSTRIVLIDSLEDSIGLSDEYINVLSHLVTVELIERGQRPARGQEGEYEVLKRQVPRVVDYVRSDILNQAQEADTDDESDYVALGGLG